MARSRSLGARTLFAALDAGDHTGLARLARAAEPVIQSVRLPSGATGD